MRCITIEPSDEDVALDVVCERCGNPIVLLDGWLLPYEDQLCKQCVLDSAPRTIWLQMDPAVPYNEQETTHCDSPVAEPEQVDIAYQRDDLVCNRQWLETELNRLKKLLENNAGRKKVVGFIDGLIWGLHTEDIPS